MFATYENSGDIYEMAKLNNENQNNCALMKEKSLVGSTRGLFF